MNETVESPEPKKNISALPASIILAAAIIGGALLIRKTPEIQERKAVEQAKMQETSSQRQSTQSVTLPFEWGETGKKLVSVGVIDKEAFLSLYAGTERDIAEKLITENISGPVIVTEQNAGVMLNLLWGLGLGNKSAILEKGEMMNPRYGGADRFASTGGFTITKGGAPMDHYSMHPFIVLTPEEEAKVLRIAQNIYRPCCDNPTNFPDCNHGMAMLGLIEILVKAGASEDEIYDSALGINALWFPEQYATIYAYAEQTPFKETSKDLLGKNFASASGYQTVLRSVSTPPAQRGGGGCSV